MGQPVVGAEVTLHTGEVGLTNGDGYVVFNNLVLGERGITAKAVGYNDSFSEAKPFESNTNITMEMERVVAPLSRLSICGIHFCTEAGTIWHWQGITAFSLLYDLSQGNQPKVEGFLDYARSHDITILRVFTTAVNLFDLPPDVGVTYTDTLLDLAASRGLYVELVGLADTAARQFNHADHIRGLGVICAFHTNCLIEIANEPNHETQDLRVRDPAYLQSLADSVPDGVLVALGASHGADDENVIYWGGDYATVHGDRKGGWDSVRHTREQQALRDSSSTLRKPVVNDEPDKYLTLDQHVALGALIKLYAIGDTIHLDPLRYSQSGGPEVEARRRGWASMVGWQGGRYCNHSSTSCDGAIDPGWDDTAIVRLYGALDGDFGYTVGLGVRDEQSIRWNWPHELLLSEGQARVWRMQK